MGSVAWTAGFNRVQELNRATLAQGAVRSRTRGLSGLLQLRVELAPSPVFVGAPVLDAQGYVLGVVTQNANALTVTNVYNVITAEEVRRILGL
jgi:hypothetical protein